MKSLRLQVPFYACLKYSFVFFGGAIFIMLATYWIGDIINNREHTIYAFQHPDKIIKVSLGLTVVMAVLFYIIFLWFASRVDVNGVHGRTYWGFKHYIPWSELAHINEMRFKGIPVLVLASRNGKEIWLYRLGLRRKAVHDALVRLLGHDHNFVSYFREK